MPKLSLELGLAIGGIILTLLLVVLDKAGRLKGGLLLWLLVVAALLTLPLATGNSFVANAASSWKWWLRAVALAVVVLSYSAITIWILPAPEVEPKTSTPPASPDTVGSGLGAIQLSLTCDTVSLPMPYRGDLWLLETIFLKGLAKYSSNLSNQDGIWPEPGVHGTGFRCVVKNHGTATAFGVTIPLEAAKRRIVRGEDGSSRGGDVIEKHNPVVSIPQPLEQQGQDSFTFYICSYDPDRLIEITLPPFAFVTGEDAKNKAKVPLRISATLGNPLWILPTKRTSPPH